MPAQTGLQAELAWRLGRGANAADVGLMIEAGPSMAKIEQRLVVEYGIELDGVWLPMAMLRRLDEHGPWSPPFTEATTDQASVLVAHGLAQPHNDGLCRGSGLRNFVDAFPFEQTMPFNKLRSEPGGSSQPADEHSRTSGPDTGPRL